MPGLDGFDVLDELKRQPDTAAIPVVIQTGMTLTPPDRERLRPRSPSSTSARTAAKR